MLIHVDRPGRNQERHDHVERGTRVGFFTDPTLCIGCKACEVACKEWNGLPAETPGWRGLSYDHTGELGASTWRHVKFLEQDVGMGARTAGPMSGEGEDPFRWLFLSDVCKHCETAGCLEACPTGAIVRTGIDSVFVQDDVCNGCGYCVVTCPFGVIDRRPGELAGGGGAYKCTFCYDRQIDGFAPACAKTCPTESILFGPLEELRRHAEGRVELLRDAGHDDAALYDAGDSSVGGTHALSLIFGEAADFGLPAAPVVGTERLRSSWTSAILAAAAILLLVLLSVG